MMWWWKERESGWKKREENQEERREEGKTRKWTTTTTTTKTRIDAQVQAQAQAVYKWSWAVQVECAMCILMLWIQLQLLNSTKIFKNTYLFVCSVGSSTVDMGGQGRLSLIPTFSNSFSSHSWLDMSNSSGSVWSIQWLISVSPFGKHVSVGLFVPLSLCFR